MNLSESSQRLDFLLKELERLQGKPLEEQPMMEKSSSEPVLDKPLPEARNSWHMTETILDSASSVQLRANRGRAGMSVVSSIFGSFVISHFSCQF